MKKSSATHGVPFIRHIDVPSAIKHGEPFQMSVQAEWPNPLWHHDRTEIETDEGNQTINISYIGKRGDGMAVMMIKPIQFSIDITIPKPGKWTLVVKGRAGDKSIDINVA